MGKKNQKITLTEEQAKQAGKLAGIGLNLDQIAAYFDMSSPTLDRLLKEDQVLADAISKGRANGIGAVANALYQQAVTGKNMTATIFYLKTRARWAEARPEDDLSSGEDRTFTLNYKI